MSTPARAALIFINWNSGALLLAAVNSLTSLPPPPQPYRLIVVDNGSSDDSLELVERTLRPALAEQAAHFCGLEVIALPTNQGFAAAVNRGLETAEEQYALILNTDIEFDNPAPELLIDALEDDPEAALACPRLLRPDGSEQGAAVPLPTMLTELTNRSLARRLLLKSLDATEEPAPVPSVVGPCMAVHLQRLQAVGWLDERFFFFFEETDWCKRIGDAGQRVLLVRRARVMHLQGEKANTRPYRARVQFYLARYQYFAKHHGRALCLLLGVLIFLRLTLNVLGNFLYAALFLARRRARDKFLLYGYLWLWHLLLCRPRWGFDQR